MLRVGERMKRRRKKTAVAARVARIERKRRMPNMIVMGLVLLVGYVGERCGVGVADRRGGKERCCRTEEQGLCE